MSETIIKSYCIGTFSAKDTGPMDDTMSSCVNIEDFRRAEVELAEKAGVDAVILSNHGGRQLEDVAAPIDRLRAIAGKSKVPLLLDSGIRSGADVVKGLAAGAQLCLLGRATLMVWQPMENQAFAKLSK